MSCPRLPDAAGQVIFFKLITLFLTAVASNGAHVEHAVAELDERATLDGDVKVSNVVQDKIDELLELGLA